MHLKKSNDGKILYYQDVNSMYPYIMIRDIPNKLKSHTQDCLNVSKENMDVIKINTFYQLSEFKFHDDC